MTYTYEDTAGKNYFNYTGSDNLKGYGYGGDDFIWGNNGDDTIYGGDGNDTLKGWYGNDYLYGNQGNDSLEGEAGNDFLAGYEGRDTLLGGDGDDTLGDWYYGEPGTDSLNGGAGNDVLYGYGGGVEYDTLTGGGGADKFVLGHATKSAFSSQYVYYLGSGYATITDFNRAEGDKFQAYGNSSDYSVRYGNATNSSADNRSLIYYKDDLIAIVQDTRDVIISTDYFNFAA